jgi:hypothetical protein
MFSNPGFSACSQVRALLAVFRDEADRATGFTNSGREKASGSSADVASSDKRMAGSAMDSNLQ